ncbi:hypothetical protein ACPOL_5327 [Acidisarcina polymorpha]|uniref:Glycine transporter domain-containing protein n=1 Tax=Acidisarcina polymorpha TaxID=2211140 RepID=A0A2Z5G703_9BACT|nr:trimeric intracellular cation channel family protein [Acidisarcina polymorpha]AXC14577.1 hypothetical protein ACPOL_5327 [Acidisarcina polymorpha]
MKTTVDALLSTVDFAGTLLFALEGAIAAIHGNLDFLGMVVLAFATAVGGGILRDLLIGATPPSAIRDWRYGAIALAGAATAFFFHQLVQEIPVMLMLTLDAAGLALFAISGAGKALEYGIHPAMAIVMGGITGVGGGTVRDVLLAQVPAVLRADVYATAALLGAAVLVIGLKLNLPRIAVGVAAASACFLLRMAAILFHWNLPKVSG